MEHIDIGKADDDKRRMVEEEQAKEKEALLNKKLWNKWLVAKYKQRGL